MSGEPYSQKSGWINHSREFSRYSLSSITCNGQYCSVFNRWLGAHCSGCSFVVWIRSNVNFPLFHIFKFISKKHMQPHSDTLGLSFVLSLHQLQYFMYASREGSGQTAPMCVLFISFSILFMLAEKALARLHLCACSSEPWLLADAVSTKISCASSIKLIVRHLRDNI